MRPLLLLTLLLNWSVAFGQEKPLVLPGKLSKPQMDIGPFTTFYEDYSSDTMSVAVILTKSFRPFSPSLAEQFQAQHKGFRWLRFTLQNNSPEDSVNLWLHVGRHHLIRLFSVDSLSRSTLLTVTGTSVAAKLIASDAPSRMAVPVVLRPGQRQTYLLSISTFQSPDFVQTTLYTPLFYKAFLNDLHQHQLPALAFYVGLIACLVFMGLFAMAQYVTNRDLIYAWYSLYVLATCFYFLRLPETFFQLDWWLPNHPLLRLALLPIVQYIALFFYTLFFGTLLELSRYQPRLWRWYRYQLMVLAALSVLAMAIYLIWGGSTLLSVYFSRSSGVVVMLLVGSELQLAALALRGRHLLRGYAFTGLVSMISGAVLMFLLNRFDIPRTNVFLLMPSLFLGSGTLLEVLCFSLALGRRTRLIEIEKKQIQQRYAHDLEAQLAQRTQEIEQQSRLLEAQHIRLLETEFERKLADTEMTALRAQMNPHFIFNCLNSIKLYTLDNEADKASDYLTKFARLIRLVLENSRSELVPLQNELEALQLYIELEAMRFKQKVQFAINVSPEIDRRYLCIPPLLLQPYVENAIWHGLMHKSEGGMVTVEVSQPKDNLLHIEITDDGVGRDRAGVLKSKSAGKHKSFGMQVTADRIRMINQLYNIQTQAQVVDLVDSFGEPCGTRVILQIPI
ncbi:MAG: histidine kinase [Rudanella sp.]|nr:histidine kinase [Rudanella sp.]